MKSAEQPYSNYSRLELYTRASIHRAEMSDPAIMTYAADADAHFKTKTTPDSSTSQLGNSIVVHGLEVQPHTQCAHWHSPLDVIAIKHRCCGKYYACISCHEALTSHPPEVWSKAEQRDGSSKNNKVVLCGVCRKEMSAQTYLECGSRCPNSDCGAAFNPGCRKHWGLYFEVDEEK
jgi:uncharacterized CHY-type Zn-finger protein